MKIKTINRPLGKQENFDACVNVYLDAGYHLVRREVIHKGVIFKKYILHAELAKPEPGDEVVSWQDAARVLSTTCENASGCSELCPMFGWCETNLPGQSFPPNSWADPDEV